MTLIIMRHFKSYFPFQNFASILLQHLALSINDDTAMALQLLQMCPWRPH
jgi:hypothetical protein